MVVPKLTNDSIPRQLPAGLRYWPSFVTEVEEAELMQAVDGPGQPQFRAMP